MNREDVSLIEGRHPLLGIDREIVFFRAYFEISKDLFGILVKRL